MICNGQSIAEIIEGWKLANGDSPYSKLVVYTKPKHFLELGTGQGASGNLIMSALLADSKFTTINYDYPSNCGFGEQLYPWKSDKRLTMLSADTTDPKTVGLVAGIGWVDFLFIDTLHEAWQAALELTLFQKILVNDALVLADDLCHNDMMEFWNSLPYEKVGVGNQGLFRYDATRPYESKFPRRKTPKEEAGL